MKVACALAMLASACSASEELGAANIIASFESKGLYEESLKEQLSLMNHNQPSQGGLRGTLSSMWRKLGGSSNTVGTATVTDAQACAMIFDSGCFGSSASDQKELADPVVVALGGGACASCAYGTSARQVNNASQCYTCSSGYSIMTWQTTPAAGTKDANQLKKKGYDTDNAYCTGMCVKDELYANTAELLSLGDMKYGKISTSTCSSIGSTYPLSCKASTATEATCFSGLDTVTLESGASKSFADVVIGDRILTADAEGELSFSDVVFLPHATNKELATFAELTTVSGKSIKATKMHLVQACSGELAYAGSFKKGGCLRTVDGPETIESAVVTTAEGLYTAVTENEFIVVNGVLASPFAVSHTAGHYYYNIHRAIYKVSPSLLTSRAAKVLNAAMASTAAVALGFSSVSM